LGNAAAVVMMAEACEKFISYKSILMGDAELHKCDTCTEDFGGS